MAVVSVQPLTPNTRSVWLAAHSPGSKVRGKVSLCLPSLWCSNTCILASIQPHYPHMHSLTRAHAHTHTHWCQLEGGSDLSLCARPTRKYCSNVACLAMSRSCRGNTVCCRKLGRLLLVAVQRLVTDSNNNNNISVSGLDGE